MTDFVHPFAGITPAPRYDGVPYVRVLVYEGSTLDAAGALVQTITVTPATDPASPTSVPVTVTTATLQDGWYSFAFQDAAGGTSERSIAVRSPALEDTAPWTPTPQGVYDLVGAWAREHVGGYARSADDRGQAGRERGAFTADTSPNLDQVLGFIAAAVEEVQGRCGVGELPPRVWKLARSTAEWHAAAAVEAKRTPSQTDDVQGLYRSFIANYAASLKELIPQARWKELRLT